MNRLDFLTHKDVKQLESAWIAEADKLAALIVDIKKSMHSSDRKGLVKDFFVALDRKVGRLKRVKTDAEFNKLSDSIHNDLSTIADSLGLETVVNQAYLDSINVEPDRELDINEEG